jgi:hypothetical protein
MVYEKDNDVKREQDRFIDRLIELCDDKSKTFQRIFVLFLALTIIFLFLIFLPYMSILEEDKQITQRISGLSRSIDLIDDARQEVNKSASDRAEVSKIVSEMTRRQQQNITISRLPDGTIISALNSSDEFKECLNSTDVGGFSGLSECVYKIFDECLNSTDVGGCVRKRFGPDAYTDPILLRVFSRLERRLEGEEMITKEKFELSAQPSPAALAILESNREQLLQNKTLLQNEKNEIADRLDQIQFPATKVPINLDDAIMVFPILLAVGFLVCINLLCNAIHLRKNFHSRYLKKNPMEAKLKDEEIALITPLWIDPLNSKLNQVIRFAIVIIPFAIFLLTWYLIINYLMASESDRSISLSPESTYYWIYSISYVLSLILFIYGCWKLVMQIRDYPL